MIDHGAGPPTAAGCSCGAVTYRPFVSSEWRSRREHGSSSRRLRPADPAGVFGITNVVITPDGTSYAYTFSSALGSLYLAEGIR